MRARASRRPATLTVALLPAAVVVVAGCSGSSGGTAPGPSPGAHGKASKLLVVVLENHSAANAMAGMPGLAAAAARYGRATHSFGLTHPSLPNYLAIAGGSTFGVGRRRACQSRIRSAAHRCSGRCWPRGRSAKTYAEGMTTPASSQLDGRYAVKHNPWPYFTSPTERAGCQRYDVPAGTPTNGALHDDIAAGTLPTFGLLIPDMCNDAHECSLSTADRWLHGWLRPLLASQDFRSGRLAIVVTFDEDHRDANNNILTAVLHRGLHGTVVTTRLDHTALSHSVSRLVGARPLRDAAAAPDLLGAFGLAG